MELRFSLCLSLKLLIFISAITTILATYSSEAKFNKRCRNGSGSSKRKSPREECTFRLDHLRTYHEVYLDCSPDGYCVCATGKFYTLWALQWTGTQCLIGEKGPCGENNGLEMSCTRGLLCIESRCRNPRRLHTGGENAPCFDDLDCHTNLTCRVSELRMPICVLSASSSTSIPRLHPVPISHHENEHIPVVQAEDHEEKEAKVPFRPPYEEEVEVPVKPPPRLSGSSRRPLKPVLPKQPDSDPDPVLNLSPPPAPLPPILEPEWSSSEMYGKPFILPARETDDDDESDLWIPEPAPESETPKPRKNALRTERDRNRNSTIELRKPVVKKVRNRNASNSIYWRTKNYDLLTFVFIVYAYMN